MYLKQQNVFIIRNLFIRFRNCFLCVCVLFYVHKLWQHWFFSASFIICFFLILSCKFLTYSNGALRGVLSFRKQEQTNKKEKKRRRTTHNQPRLHFMGSKLFRSQFQRYDFGFFKNFTNEIEDRNEQFFV